MKKIVFTFLLLFLIQTIQPHNHKINRLHDWLEYKEKLEKKEKEKESLNQFKLRLTNYLNLNKIEKIYYKKIKLDEDFYNKLQRISDTLNVKPEWLYKIMWKESKLNPKAINKYTKAYGLIQFMPKTQKWLKIHNLQSKTAKEQLNDVLSFYSVWGKEYNSIADLYLITVFPAAVGKSNNYVFSSKRTSVSKIAQQNPYWDLNKDNKVTLKEFKIFFNKNF